MNLKVGYLPFSGDAELKRMAENVIEAHNSQHKVDRFAPHLIQSGAKALSHVYRVQQLYIFAHGAAGSHSVSDSGGGSLTVTQLAQQLMAEKLTPAILKVKLWVCEGGANGAGSTAKQFKLAMVSAGFTSVTVFGYTKFLSDGLIGSHKMGADLAFNPDGSISAVSNESKAKTIREKF